MVQIHEKLQELIAWRGTTQYILADRVDVPHGSISSYITGRTTISLDLAYKFAKALGVTPWTLLNGEPLLASMDDLSEAELNWVTDMRGLTLEQQDLVFALMGRMKEQNKR